MGGYVYAVRPDQSKFRASIFHACWSGTIGICTEKVCGSDKWQKGLYEE